MSAERLRPDAALIERLRAAIGDAGVVDDEPALRHYNASPWSQAEGGAHVVLKPRSTKEVSACMQLCAAARVGVVPYGGGTGFLGGQIASADGSEIVLSLERMTAIRSLDAVSAACDRWGRGHGGRSARSGAGGR
ncbi:MAG: FAD-binding oxidoreductase, partial [Sphingomonas sp.]|nr:FAD-binding oxidoreductase [Sphingomonas sp.]